MTQDEREGAIPDQPAHRESPSEQAAGQVAEAASTAREQVRSAAGQARSRLADQVDRRSTDAGKRVGASAADVRSVADTLRDQGRDGAANLAEQVARRGERLGRYLEDADSDRLIQDVEDFARRRPWAVAAGALAAGFAAARFLKASSGRRYHAASQPGRSSSRTAAWVGSREDDEYDRAERVDVPPSTVFDTREQWPSGRSEPRAYPPTATGTSEAPPVTRPQDVSRAGETSASRPGEWPPRDPDRGDEPGGTADLPRGT